MTHLVICVQFSKTFWQVSKLFPPRTLYSAFNDGYLVQGKICVIPPPSLALATRKLDTERGISHPGSKGWNVFDICLVLVRSVWWGRVSGDECTEGKFDVPGGPGHDTTDNGDTVVTSSHRGGKRGHWWQYWHFSLQRRVPERCIDNRDMEQVPSEDNKHGFKETHW